MNLYVDLGNTSLVIGIFADEKVLSTFRTATNLNKTSDEYASIFINYLKDNNFNKAEIKNVMISSVVPPLNNTIRAAIKNTLNLEPSFIAAGIKTGLLIKMDNPNEVGADLIATAVGAIAKYNYPLLIVDLGTASKLTVINDKGAFIGGVIMPGIHLSMRTLAENTANLPKIALERPKFIIGKNTPDAMNSGAIYGTMEMVKGLCVEIEKELGYACRRILTGGYSKLVSPLIENAFTLDPLLTLEGIHAIFMKNEAGKNAK